jgi:hypothetical protein
VTFLVLGANCYGGLARTGFMRGVLALESACVARSVRLKVELGGGEALISRARAGALAQFLAGEATHLILCDSDVTFVPEAIFGLLGSGADVAGAPGEGGNLAPGLMLVSRKAARAVADAHPQLRASLRDLRGASPGSMAPMVFDSLVDPETGRYLADFDAFCRRWRDLGGDVFADPALSPWR